MNSDFDSATLQMIEEGQFGFLGQADPLPAEFIAVEIGPTADGWCPIALKTRNQSLSTELSAVYPPFHQIIEWLEIIVAGRPSISSIDIESETLELHALCFENSIDIRLRAFVQDDLGRPDTNRGLVDCIIPKKLAVASIYDGIMNFGESAKFLQEEWCECKIAGVVERLLPTTTIPQIANYPSDELVGFFKIALPCAGLTKEPNVLQIMREKFGEWRENRKLRAQGIEPVLEFRAQTLIPKNYDNWNDKRREDFIEEFLNQEITWWSGDNPRKLGSSFIETALGR